MVRHNSKIDCNVIATNNKNCKIKCWFTHCSDELRQTWQACDFEFLQNAGGQHLGLDIRHVHAQADARAWRHEMPHTHTVRELSTHATKHTRIKLKKQNNKLGSQQARNQRTSIERSELERRRLGLAIQPALRRERKRVGP